MRTGLVIAARLSRMATLQYRILLRLQAGKGGCDYERCLHMRDDKTNFTRPFPPFPRPDMKVIRDKALWSMRGRWFK